MQHPISFPDRVHPHLISVALLLCVGLSFAHAAPPAGSEWIPIPELTDEFDGEELDAAKWHDHNPTWRGRRPGLFAKTNVSVAGGSLHLRAMLEDVPNAPAGYHTFTTAAVKSKALVKYGYFEIKCRPMKSKASSAFWFYHDTASEWTEIDVFEICGEGAEWLGKYNMNAHVFRSPTITTLTSYPAYWQAPFDFTAEDHIYALEWNAEVIRWYVDGVMVRELENQHWHQALAMNFDSETMPEWFGLPDPDTLPSIFSIDYIRSWRAPALTWDSDLELARYTLNDTDRLDPTAVDPLVTASAFQINGQNEDSDGDSLDDDTYQFTPSGLTINRGHEDFWKPANLAAPFQFTITANGQDILVNSVTITAASPSVHVTAARLGTSTTVDEYGSQVSFAPEGQTLEVILPAPYLITAGSSRTFFIDLDSNAFESTHEFGTIIVNGTADVPLVINNFADGSDDATGISGNTTYTHLIDINKGASTAVINGVTFDNTLGSYTLNGPAGTFANNPANGADPGSGMSVLLNNFRFGSTAPHVLTLSGLTPETTYKLRLYTSHWNGSNVTIFFDDTSPATVVGGIDRGAGQVIPSSIDYTYTTGPGDTDLVVTVTSPSYNTFHWYAFSNEVIGGDTFGDWIADFPGVGGQDGLADDSDGDGIPNGVENLFGTDPAAFSRGLIAEGYDTGSFTFTHPQGTLASDLSAAYRWSKDIVNFLGDLETDGDGTTVEFTAQPDTPSPGTTTVTAELTGAAAEKLFVVVEVTQN